MVSWDFWRNHQADHCLCSALNFYSGHVRLYLDRNTGWPDLFVVFLTLYMRIPGILTHATTRRKSIPTRPS
jgi:hypothetical protein